MASIDAPHPLSALLPEEIAALASIDPVDARRIWACVQREGALPARAPATIRRAALEQVRAFAKDRGEAPALTLLERRASDLDPFVKYAFGGADGRELETVRIPLEKPGRYSVCVSSQVGCALACAFCATGRMGLVRNLQAWEIVEQVRAVRADLPPAGRVHGVVFQGMGEPMSNLDRVLRAIRVISDPSGLAVDRRNITVCTSGLPSGIRRLAAEVPQVRLGLSIGDARAPRRKQLMPIDETHRLDDVLEAAAEHTKISGHAPMWAYTLLAGVNDSAEAALALAERAVAFERVAGMRPRLSLIPYNDVSGAGFARSEAMSTFRDVLRSAGVGSIVRYSGGGDVGAACGQLVRGPNDRPRPRRETAVLDPSQAKS